MPSALKVQVTSISSLYLYFGWVSFDCTAKAKKLSSVEIGCKNIHSVVSRLVLSPIVTGSELPWLGLGFGTYFQWGGHKNKPLV